MLDSLRGILRQNRQHHSTDISIDELYKVLSNRRRRAVIRLLRREGGELEVAELAEMMADEAGNKARTREYVALHQQHLPRLEEAGVVRYDQRQKIVRPGKNLEVVYCIHDQVVAVLPERSTENP